MRRVRIVPDEPLDVSAGSGCQPRRGRRPGSAAARLVDGLDEEAADGAFWLLLERDERVATWRRAPYDPAPARARARALGIDDGPLSAPPPAWRADARGTKRPR